MSLLPFTGFSVNCQSKAEVHLTADVTIPAVPAVNAGRGSLMLSTDY